MPVFVLRFILFFTACTFILTPAWAAEVRRTKVLRTTEPMRIDGVLDESVWINGETIGDLIQADPFPGKPPTERTEVRLARNEKALYIAARCFDRDTKKLFTSTMLRDAQFYTDDGLEIVIDTFHDLRNAYYFSVNAVGAMTDGKVIENRGADLSWDGIWDGKTTIDELGWTAELEIPFQTLSFNPDNDEWGFNIERIYARLDEDDRWEAISRDVEVVAVARAGVIEGMKGLSQGIGLDVKPYGLLGVNRDITRPDHVKPVKDAGVDFFYRVTADLLSSTTINTDFAETEVDTRQVNLTRFPLLYPEKRDFFLEDAGVFQFGFAGIGNPTYAPMLQSSSKMVIPYFSRRIGLVRGSEVPILLGEKLTGKVGRLELGVVAVRTRDGEYTNTSGELVSVPAQNFFVGRAKYGLLRESYVGGIYTYGEPTGTRHNNLFGMDFALATSNFLGRRKSFSVSGFGLKSNTSGIENRDYAYGAQVAYPNDLFHLGASWQDIGQNFNPELGYFSRRGVRITTATAKWGPRPKLANIRQMLFMFGFTNSFNRVYNAVETRTYSVSPFQLTFLGGGANVKYELIHNFERLFVPFAINRNVTIPAGDYSFLQHAISYQNPRNVQFAYRIAYAKGHFYSGNSDQLTINTSWRPSAVFSLGADLTQYWIRLKEGSFNTSLALGRFNYSFNPNLGLTNFIQYDTVSRNIGLQSRLYWIIKPGSEAYFVFNHEWQENILDRFEAQRLDARIKLNYTFRF